METSKQKNESESTSKKEQHWLLGANPQITQLLPKKCGEKVTYPLYNKVGTPHSYPNCFRDAREGDDVIGYEGGGPGIVAILRVKREQNGVNIEFEKTQEVTPSITFDIMLKYPELERVVKLVRGKSLSKLNLKEYYFLKGLIAGITI